MFISLDEQKELKVLFQSYASAKRFLKENRKKQRQTDWKVDEIC